jgi:hypothetical protein
MQAAAKLVAHRLGKNNHAINYFSLKLDGYHDSIFPERTVQHFIGSQRRRSVFLPWL